MAAIPPNNPPMIGLTTFEIPDGEEEGDPIDVEMGAVVGRTHVDSSDEEDSDSDDDRAVVLPVHVAVAAVPARQARSTMSERFAFGLGLCMFGIMIFLSIKYPCQRDCDY